MDSGYYRFPTVHEDTVVFVAEDDLWQVDCTGGPARRLTAGLGSIARPQFSPDGQWLAFTGKEEGDTEVYVMPSDGGEVRRLTYLGSDAAIVGWHADGRIIFSTYYGHPFMAWRSLYAVSKDGGEPEPLPYGRASWVSFGPRGSVVLGRPTTNSAYWKRYRGGTRGMLWIDAGGQGRFEKFSLEDGSVITPLWIGSRIYFISDHEGHANLYSIKSDGSDIQRHTHHDDYYVRNISTDGRSIVYHAGADLYYYDLASDSARRIPVKFRSQGTQREIKHVDAANYWSEYAFTKNDQKLLITARGKLFHLAPFAGPVLPLGTPQGVRYRLTRAIDESNFLTVSDEGGEDRLEIRSIAPEPAPNVVPVPFDTGIIDELKTAPNGQFAAFSNERMELWVLDLKTLDCTPIAKTVHGHIAGFDWSPDSQWIAYALPGEVTTPLFLYGLATKVSHQLTNPILADRRPSFDPEGKFLYFLSRRVFKPVWDNMKFDLGFPKGEVPCVIPLAKDTTSPFIPDPEPLIAASDKSDDTGNVIVRIDLDGIDQRVLSFPVEEGIYGDIAGAHGSVFWTKRPPGPDENNTLAAGPPPAEDELVRFEFKSLKEDTVLSKMTSFCLSPDQKLLAVRNGSELRVVKVGDKIDPKETKPGRESGVVDLARIHVAVEQLAEWYQMQREAWRWMREMFWVPDMGGVDWENVYHRYRNLMPRIATRGEFSDLIWEMQGELGSSHAYEFGGHYRAEPQHRVAFLGADYRWQRDANGYRITHLIRGDSADSAKTSPLLTPGANISDQDIITAIDGQPLGPDLPPGSRLIDRAGQDVSISVRSADDGERTVTVRPLKTEIPARYREWVDQNRHLVHERTNGRVGYIHVPNMSSAGFAEFHRGYLAEFNRQGLIIDVRYNGGGIVSPLLLEMLGRKRIAFARLRQGHLEAYPYQSPTGAMVALTNEHAGSDGDIFSHAFKLMKLGPLIGTRTWGGVIGINPRYALVDWGSTSQPEDAFWFKDVGLGVENYGTDPDILVEETPHAMAKGIDEQLERAILEIGKILADFVPLTPDYDHRPDRRPTPLP